MTFIALAFASGLASLLTPCVLPAIPLTLGFFAARRREGRSAVGDAALFAAGIVVSFTALAIVTSVTIGASGINRLAADPWLNTVIGLVFVVSALALIGVVSVRVPGVIVDRADRFARTAPGAVAPAAIGIVFSLATFACTAPFVGPLLVAASVGEWTRPVTGMVAYSTAFAAPFFVLALAPAWAERVPRTGPWLYDVRLCIAAVQLAVAMKFLSTAANVSGIARVDRTTVLAAWLVIAAALALVLLRRAAASYAGRWPRAVAAVSVLVLGAWLARGTRGTPVGELEALLPPPAADDIAYAWIDDFDVALTEARRQNRPVFLDFTGYSCGNCRWMEANVFATERVRAALKPFVLARLFTDGEGPAFERNQRLQEERFGTVALPLYAVLSADGTTRASFIGVTRDVDKFVRFIEGALE